MGRGVCPALGVAAGKTAAVVIYNTDGKIGRYEHRIKVACERGGVVFYSVP